MIRISKEEIKELQKIKMVPSREQVIRSKCNHVKENGDDAVQYSSTEDIYTCSICGRRFKPLDMDISLDCVKHYSQTMINTVETLKLLDDYLPDYINYDILCGIIPVIEKIPEIFRDTRKKFDKENTKSVDPFKEVSNILNRFNKDQLDILPEERKD